MYPFRDVPKDKNKSKGRIVCGMKALKDGWVRHLSCIIYAKERGFQAIRLDVVPDNVPAKKLYEKCGFVYVGDVDLEHGIEAIPEFSMYEYWIGA